VHSVLFLSNISCYIKTQQIEAVPEHIMNPYAGVEMYLHSLDGSGQLHAPAVLPTGRELRVLQTKPRA